MAPDTYPRPQLVRDEWLCLDGLWDFAFDPGAQWTSPRDVVFDSEILVPYPPGSTASGVSESPGAQVVWYRKRLDLRTAMSVKGQRLLLHLGAVDYRARVWANGELVCEHEGGHTPFYADITEAVSDRDVLEVVVRAEDETTDLSQPRGKQSWRPEPYAVWYPRTTGIWQTVWLEAVPRTHIAGVHWTPDVARWELSAELRVHGRVPAGATARVRLYAAGRELACCTTIVSSSRTRLRLTLPDPGIEEERNLLLWSPEHPNIIDARVELLNAETVLDTVASYSAMRSVGVRGHHFTLNGQPYFLRFVLDQGYWPDTLLAASDERLRRDAELAKMLGFNGVRKHQKIESPRWLYWCDVLGLLVWEEMPSHYAFTNDAIHRLIREWSEALERDRSHPCVMAWVPFNESWGVPDLHENAAQRDYVRAVYHLTKAIDPTRPAIANDGWEFVEGDFAGVHDYADSPAKLIERYGVPSALSETVERPWRRALAIGGCSLGDRPVALSEFGGIAFETEKPAGWGYSRATDQDGFLKRFESLMKAAHSLKSFAGFCYTQLTDTLQEKNGLLTELRQPKADIRDLARITRGELDSHELEMGGDPDLFGYTKRWFTSPHLKLEDAQPRDLTTSTGATGRLQ